MARTKNISSDRLQLLPAYMYVLKAGAVRLRSSAWHVRTRGRADFVGIRILFYHRISADPDILAVHPDRFRDQMAFLVKAGYKVLDLVEAAEALAAGSLPTPAVALTFDDAYADVAENALPILEEHGFGATVFVVPRAVDGEVRFGWYTGEQPPLLSWDDILRLDGQSALRFEAHSLTHPNLVALDAEAAEREIAGSKLELQERLGRPVEAFAYPAGIFGERERSLAERAGYRVAVSCEPGSNGPNTDPFALRRLQIDAKDSLLDFRAKVGGGHDQPLPLRRLYRRARYRSDPVLVRADSSRR